MAAMLPLPKQVWAHGWFLMDAAKMSKSKGNVVLPRPIANMLGMDALRYFMLREVVFGQDGNFSYDALVTRYNSDLANGLGNLASRVASMIEQSFDGVIPAPYRGHFADTAFGTEVNAIAEYVSQEVIPNTIERYERCQFSGVLTQVWALVSNVNGFLVRWAPWSLAKTAENFGASGEGLESRRKLETILYSSAEALRVIAILAAPIIPDGARKIWKLLGQPGLVEAQALDSLAWDGLKPGVKLGKLESIYPRVEKDEAIERIESMSIEEQNAASAAPKPASAGAALPAPPAPGAAPAVPDKIAIEDFAKVEMRVGQIKTAERIVGADKLLKLTVDIGTEIRQICAGIAQYYEPETLIGRKVVVVVNLAPRKLRGVESNGMVIAASVGPEGRPVIAGFLEDVEVGARLK